MMTPTEQRMAEILADGLPHTKEELHACCGPSSIEVVYFHINNLKTKLRPQGEDIICEFKFMKYYYRQVRLLASPYND